MAESPEHKTTAELLAARYNATYNSGQGPDIQTSEITIEVETLESIADAEDQLRGYTGPVYVAGTSPGCSQRCLKILCFF